MPSRLDLSALSPAERIVAAGGALLFVNGFVPWWYRIRTPGGTYLHNAGLTGWGLAAVAMGFAATVAVVGRGTGRRPARRAPGERVRGATDWAWYVALGAGAMTALGAQARSSRVEWVGFWFAAAFALLLLVGGVRRRRERRGGWL